MNNKNYTLWKKIAYISASFSVIVSFLLIVNYFQYTKLDPVESEVIDNLVERLDENPNNQALREEIRTIDLLSRKAYFTSQWQIKTGGYLLLIGVIVFVIAMQMLNTGRNEVEYLEKEDIFLAQAKSRKWLALGGSAIVVFALLSAFLSHNKLSDKFADSAMPDSLRNNSATAPKKINRENTENELATEELAEEELTDTITAQSDSTQTDTAKEEELAPYPTYKEITQNFPTFRGAGGNGVVYKKGVPTSWNGSSGKNMLWKTKVPLHGYNSPVIWGDKVFLTGATATKRQVYCFDANTGKILWTHDVSGVPGSKPSPKVTDDTGHAAPTAATDGRRVYGIFANGDVVAVNMEGKRVWAKNLGVLGNHYGHSSSLMLFRNKLIVQYDQKKEAKLMALATETGNTVWSTKRDVKISWASPIVVFTGKSTEIILSADPYVASYNPYSGKENWKLDCMYGEVGPSPAYADGVVYATNEYAVLIAIKLSEKPEKLWETDEYLSDVPSPIATKDYLFLVTSYGTVACYDAKNGKIIWEHDFPEGFYGSPVLVSGRIYVTDMSGTTQVFSASGKFTKIASNALGEKSMTTPAFAENRIYIRGEKHLFCFGK